MARIVLIGEAMLELSRQGEAWRLGYGGDTLNTAIHLARAGHDVAYLTAIGCDPLSAGLKAAWAGEGLDTSLILDHPTRSTGLYAISTDDQGERSFSYWRDSSAAREMLALPDIKAALAVAEQADLIVYSLITLAGGTVAFDGNYRPRLWANAAEAREARDAGIACADIGLPTLDDELVINSSPERGGGKRSETEGSGAVPPMPTSSEPAPPSASPPPPRSGEDLVAHHWTTLGCPETIVKLGAKGARLLDGTILPPPEILHPVDTSGAGDAFNGGYLAARMDGASVEEAAMTGHRLAGWCVMRAGAIPARDGNASY
jgi:2-dehydro-3-deoxygluconokinase